MIQAKTYAPKKFWDKNFGASQIIFTVIFGVSLINTKFYFCIYYLLLSRNLHSYIFPQFNPWLKLYH